MSRQMTRYQLLDVTKSEYVNRHKYTKIRCETIRREFKTEQEAHRFIANQCIGSIPWMGLRCEAYGQALFLIGKTVDKIDSIPIFKNKTKYFKHWLRELYSTDVESFTEVICILRSQYINTLQTYWDYYQREDYFEKHYSLVLPSMFEIKKVVTDVIYKPRKKKEVVAEGA